MNCTSDKHLVNYTGELHRYCVVQYLQLIFLVIHHKTQIFSQQFFFKLIIFFSALLSISESMEKYNREINKQTKTK